jgi:UDP-glucose 4-epimerase
MTTGIVGSSGFIGSCLLRYIAARDSDSLRLLVRNTEDYHGPSNAELLHGDLLSRSDCERFAADLKLIYYLAHNNSPVNSDLDLPNDALANLVPLLNLLQAIQHLGTKPHVVYFSSGGAVYARKQELVPYRETDHCAPSSSYGIQKLAAEQYLRLAADKGYLTATVLRVGNAYGSLVSQFRPQGLIGVAISRVVNGKPVRVFGNPNNVRDYIHLDDISDLALRASIRRQPFSILNVGSGVGHSVLDVIRAIEERWGRPVEILADHSLGDWLTDWAVLDITKAHAELGWSPTLDLHSGIDRMLSKLFSESMQSFPGDAYDELLHDRLRDVSSKAANSYTGVNGFSVRTSLRSIE